jgi:hypothetical protein
MCGRCDLFSGTVETVGGTSSVPCYITAEQRATGGAATLTRDYGELGWGCWELVQICYAADQRGEPGGAAGEASGGGEVVLGSDAQWEGG